MKKIILIFALISLSISFTACKKNSKKSQTPSVVYCIFTTSSTNVKSFYKCTDSEEEMQSEMIKLRNEGVFASTSEKSTCSECQ